MKIGNSAENLLITNAETQSRGKFGIQATGKAFWILSNALYQHKVRAVVREVGCNAYDAHISAGTTDRPFDVTLPSAGDPHFRVRDYGIGLAEDKFIEIYTTYFGSTKSESNEETGGLGLGSKTPFIMSKTFTVHSYYNGVDYMWHSFVNDNGEPDVMLLNKRPTTEPNGLLVIVPVGQGQSETERNALFREFVTEAKNIYQWFDTIPNVKSGEDEIQIVSRLRSPDTTYTSLAVTGVGTQTRVHYDSEQRSTSQSNTVLIKMGNVVYPYNLSETRNLDRFGGNIIHTEQLIKYITRNGRLNPTDQHLVIEVAMGDVDFAPSREALSLNNSTELMIINAIVRFMTIFAQSIQAGIDQATTTFEKYNYLYAVAPIPNVTFTIDGKSVTPFDQRPVWLFQNGTTLPNNYLGKGHAPLRTFDTEDLTVRYRRAGTRGLKAASGPFDMMMYGPGVKDRTVILIDKAYKGELRLWVNANVKMGDAVVVVSGEDRAPLTAAQMAPFLEDGHPQVMKLSAMKAPVIAPTAKRPLDNKVTSEIALIMSYTNTRYGYFTQGNGVNIPISDMLVFDPKAPKLYIAFQKKGNVVSSHLNSAADQKVEMREVSTWSRAAGRYSSNYSAVITHDTIYNPINNLMNAGQPVVCNLTTDAGDVSFNINSPGWNNSAANLLQVVMTADAYAEVVDKPEYPHIMSLDSYITKVLRPSLPKNLSSVLISDEGTPFTGQERDSNLLLEAFQLADVVDFVNQVDSMQTDIAEAVHNVQTTLQHYGYDVIPSTEQEIVYDFSIKAFGEAAKAAKANGVLPEILYDVLFDLTDRFTSAGSAEYIFETGYYRGNSHSVGFAKRTLNRIMAAANYNPQAFSDYVVQYYEASKSVS